MAEHKQEIDAFGAKDDFWLFGYGSLIWKPPPHYDQRIPGYIEGYVRRFWQASEDHRGTPSAPGRVATLIDHAHWSTLADVHNTSGERVWGAAYHIPSTHVTQVREYLDIREINGYSIQFTPFHPAPFTTSISSPPSTPVPRIGEAEAGAEAGIGGAAAASTWHRSARSITASTTIFAKLETQVPPITSLVYIGLPENPQFLGPQDPDGLARHILKSRGPSGENREYLFLLEKSLLELSKDSGDDHVSDLVRRCREIEAEEARSRGESLEAGEDDVDSEERETIGEPLHRLGSTEEQEEVER